MEDRFRFRIWDVAQRTWVTEDYLIDPYDGTLAEDGQSCGYPEKNDGKILMQCTGLKDKNGKLIYEGDVLQGVYFNEHDTYVVCWHCSGFRLFYPRDWVDQENPVDVLNFMVEHEFIVSGNVHENHELLNSSKS
jgi:uncharacterized phage protein (TIGR01671 family)